MAYSFVDPTVLERLSPSSCCTITGALLVLSIPSSHTDFSPFHPHTGHRAELSAVYTDFSWRDGSVALILQRRQGSVTMRSYGARGGKFATIRSDPGMTLGPKGLIGMRPCLHSVNFVIWERRVAITCRLRICWWDRTSAGSRREFQHCAPHLSTKLAGSPRNAFLQF